MATLHVGADQTYKTINEAVAAAATTEETTIVISAGTYNEDITLDARTMDQKGNIKFIAAEGADVTFSGLFTIGYYEKRVGSKKWDADVTFENITFDQAADDKHSIDIQQCNDFTMTNCKVIGYGEYGILGTNVDNGATITGTTFENAGIQSAGSFGTNLLIDDCTFDDSRVNIQSGNSVAVQNCTFKNTLTDANVGDSFYCIRSNDNAINITGTTFNIDSDLTEVAADQEKWGVLWQRNAGGTKWTANDIEVNFSDKAMEQSELLFNKNGTTNAANEAGRITISGLTSSDNDVTELLAQSEGVLNASADGVSYVLDDGLVQSKTAANQLVVSADVAGMEADTKIVIDGFTYIVGKTAFATINAALTEAKKTTEKVTIEIAAGDYTENVSFGNRTFVENETTYTGGITFKAVDGAVVNINGYFQCNSPVNDIKDVVFDGLNITNSVRNGGYFAPIMFGDNYAGKTASGLAVKNCTLNSTAADGTSSGVALTMALKCDGIDITNNTVNADCGVYGGDGNLIANTVISGNTMNGNEVVPSYNYWGVVYIYNSGAGNVISDNTISNSALNAVKVNKGNGIVFTGNDITDCGKTVITNGSVVTGTTVDGNALSDSYPAYDGSALIVCGGIAGETGDTVVIDGKSYVVGNNAFAGMVEALKNVSAATEKIEITGDITEDIPAATMEIALAKDLLISGNGEAASKITLNNGGYKTLVFGSDEGSEDVAVKFANVKLEAPQTQIIFGNSAYADDGSIVYSPVNAEIDGSSLVSAYVVAVESESVVNVLEGGKFFSTGEVMNIKGTLNVTGNEAFDPASDVLDRQIVAHYMWDYGTVALEDSYATIYSQMRLRGADSSFTADNSLIEIGKKVDGTWMSNPSANGVGWINADGTMTLTNKTIMLVNGATGRGGYGLTVNADSEFNVESGSTAEFSAGVSNAGTITVDNATLKVGTLFAGAGTQPPAIDLANNGTIEVSGESTLDIAELSGSRITFAEDTTLVDSNINYTGSDSFRFDGVTFKGDNTINAKAFATSGMSFAVAEGGSLTATGARWTLGGTGVWDINGSIKDAKVLTDAEIAELKAALDVNGLSLSTGGGEAVMNVNNAYFTFGSGHITSKNTNATGGKIVMNFNNSVVKSANKYAINPTKDGYDAANAPEIVLNVTNSVFAINNYFTNNHAKGTVSIDNSNFTATAFGNVGEFTAANGSKVNFALVNNGLNDWAGKGSLNAGTITVDASELTIVNKTASLEFYNVGSITLSNGATFTLDQLVNAKANDLTGSGNISTTFADMAGSITIDATSQLVVTGKFENAGTITIDGTGFTSGTNKVIDLNGTESLQGKITIENLEEGITVAYGKDGDVLLTDASLQKLYVNSAYADKEFGAVDGDKVFGINAFGSLVDALDAKMADTEEIVIESDITEALSGKTISGKLTADSDVTIADSANNNYANFTGVTLDENITVDAKYFYLYGENTFNGDVKSSTTFYSTGKLTLTGNAEVYTTMSRSYTALEDGIYVVGSAAAGEGKNAAVQYKSINYLGHYSGTFSVKDTAAEFGYILLNGSNDGDIQAQLVLDNAKVSTIGGPNGQPGQVQMNDDATIIATNDSVLDFRGPKDFGYISMTATNSISLTDSTMYLGKEGQGTNTLAGTITLKNSTLNSLGKLNSTAAINIDATSSIVATTITGTGTITIDVKGYTGDTFKAIDVNSAIANTVKLTNASDKYYLTYGEDGDVYVNKSPEFVYVSSDYNSSTEGWGVTKFANYDSAVAFVKNNARKATIVMEKTTTVSGNCVKDNKEDLGIDLTNTLVIKDGAVMGNAQSKWDMTYAVTIEGGGILQSARPSSAGIGNTHIKNKLTIGDGSDKQAKVLFINGKNGVTYQTMSIALLSGLNRSITANNALIEVGDLGIQSTASFTDTTLTIDGILAIKGTSLYKTTMTDTEVTIKGHNLMNENTYYSTVGTILATLTMDNSSIVVDDGKADTVAEKVWLGYTGNVAQTLTMTNGSSITVEEGAEVEVANKVVMTDSSLTVGNLNAGKTKAENSSFYFNQLEKGKVYYAVLYDAEGNELETIVRTSTSGSTFYPKFSIQPVGEYTAKCFKDEAKTELHQEKTYKFIAVGTMDLTNSDLYGKEITLAGNNLTMDINSTVGFTGINGGYITVKDAANYVDNEGVTDGTYKLFDYTGDGEMTADGYKAILNDVWHDNYLVFNNDLYLTDQDMGTLYVNGEYAGSETGKILANGSIYEFNAFDEFADIYDKIATDGSDTVIKLESNLEAGTIEFKYGSGDITFTADKAVTVKQNGVADWGFTVGDVSSTITIGKNVTFQINENASGLYVYYGNNLNIEGTLTGGANWGCAYLAYGDHQVAESGELSTGRVHLAWTTLTVNGNLDTNYLLAEESTFTANKATVDAAAIHDSNNGGLRYGASEFSINDSVLTANSVTLKHADTKFNVNGGSFKIAGTFTNGASATFTKAEGNFGTFDNSGKVDFTSAKAIANNAINTGDIKANNSSIQFKEFNNAEGTVSVTGDTYLKIDKLTGEINAADATITGSVVGGTLNVTGDVVITKSDMASSVKVAADKTLTVIDEVTFGSLVNNGNVSMTGYDTLTVKGAFTNAGIITIDLTNFSGVDKKVVDLSGSFDWIEGTNVEFIGKDDDTIIDWGTAEQAGDVIITKVDKSSLLVDDKFADAEEFEEVEPGWVKDANAFAGTSEIIWSEKTEAIIIRDGAYDDFTVERDNVIDLATDAAEGSIVKLNTNIKTNVTVKDIYAVTGNVNVAENASADVTGTLAVNGTVENAGDLLVNGKVTAAEIVNNSVVDVNGTLAAEVMTNNNKVQVNAGEGEALTSLIKIGAFSGNAIELAGGTLTDSEIKAAEGFDGTVLEVIDDAIINNSTITSVKVLAEKTMTATGSVNFDSMLNAGKVVVSESAELAADSIENTGWVDVTGTLTAENIKNDKDLQVKGEAVVSGIENTGLVDVTGTLTAENIKNDKDLLVNGKVSADSIENSGLLDVTGTLAVKDEITNAGSITVTDKASFSAGSVANNGSLALSGNVTVNTTVTGNAVELASGAVLAGSLTADTLNVGEKGASLAGNAAVNAAVTGGTLSISGAGNQLTLKDGSTVGLIVANGTSFQKEDDLDSVVITGAADDTVIIAADGAFDGNTVENAKLVITDLEEDKQIKVKIDIANIISINANELKLLNGVYYYESDNKLMFVEKDAAGFITVTDGSGDLAVKTDEIASITIKEDSTKWANLNIVMESGNTSVTVKNGKKSKDGIDYMEFAIGGILKSDLGGTNNVKFGNYNKVAVNGNIDAISNLTIGNNSFVNIGKFIYDKDGNIIDKNEGDIDGQNNNNAIRIGSDSVVNIAGDIDLAGGRNNLNIGARSDVAIYGDIDGASNFVVGSGKKAKKDGSGADWTNVTINGDYIAAEMNNNLNIGNYVNFTLGGNIENGGVKSGTGTNLRVGTESVMTVAGKADGMSAINTGKKSNVSFAGAVDGTANNNRINVGAEAVFSAGDIDLYGGNNTIVTGKGATFTAGSIENVKTVNIGAQSSFVSDDIADVSRFTVGNGKAATRTEDAKLTEVKVNGEVSMSTGNDNFKVGNNSNVVVTDDIIFGAGKDTLTIGMDSKLTVSDISGMDRFNASWGAVLEIRNGANNDVELGLVTGSWDKATIIDDEGDLLVGPANIGSVYENEVDCYEYKVYFNNKLTFEGSEGVEIQYSYNVNGTWTEWVDYNDEVGLQAPGEYRIFVSVAGDYEDKYSKLNYTLEAKLA